MKKSVFLVPLFLSSTLLATFPKEAESKILYLAHKGEIMQAFTCYLDEAKKHEHNYKLLQMTGLRLLEDGMRNPEMDIKLLSLLGAGVALNKATLPILKEALRNGSPELQMASLHFLARFEEDEALSLLQEALSSPVLLVRLEAALILAEKQNPVVVDHLASFYGKVPPLARTLFPQILVEIETDASTKFLKQLLSETDMHIRLATIVQLGLAKRDDLLENIRMLLTHPSYMEAEASAFALGKMQDVESKTQLWKLCERKNLETKLAALQALHEMGDKIALNNILQMAEEKNLFAIALLGDCNDCPAALDILLKLIEDQDFDIKLNANFSLLKLKSISSLSFFEKLLLEEGRDIGYQTCHSPGKALSYMKSVSSVSQKIEKDPRLEGETQRFKAKILVKALELPEEDFLRFANSFFEKQSKSPLIPYFIELICNKQSEKSLAFLKSKLELAGAPYIRAYVTLALYRLTHEEIYEEKLLSFIKLERGKEFMLQLPKASHSEESSPHLLTAKETSSFLINAFETLASSPQPKVLEALIEAIAYGNPKNRYALAGLLIRMTE